MRARLCSPTVPILALAFLAAVPARAGTRDDVTAGVARCAGIVDDRTWLDCFYGAAQPMRALLGLPPAPAFQVRLVPPVTTAAAGPVVGTSAATAATPLRGKDGPFGGFLDKTEWVYLASYSFDKHGMFAVTLSDGTQWQQRQEDVNYAHWRKPPASYRVEISGVSEAATLTVENDGQEYQVSRVR